MWFLLKSELRKRRNCQNLTLLFKLYKQRCFLFGKRLFRCLQRCLYYDDIFHIIDLIKVQRELGIPEDHLKLQP